jgi:hypothetical protein
MRVRRIGYDAPPIVITVIEGQTLSQPVTMRRLAVTLASVEVVVGSRARHTAADELAVPVDVFTSSAGTTRAGAIGARNVFDVYPDRMSSNNGFDIFPFPPASPFGYNGRWVYTRLELVRDGSRAGFDAGLVA